MLGLKTKKTGIEIKDKIEYIIRKIPFEILYIFFLFIITRVVLTAIGFYSQIFIDGPNLYRPVPNDNIPLSFYHIWSVWDSGWYASIAANGYSAVTADGKASIAFFPLYPLLMRLFGIIIGNYYYIGIIISNVCLIIACIYLYKLVKLESDNNTALDSIKYLILFPTAFILSGVFTESLYLALLVMCFYYAKKENWLYVGIFGFLLSLTRYIGILVALPLLYIYLQQKKFKINELKADILYFILIPAGLFVFMIYNYYLSGDFLAFYHINNSGWGTHLTNPLELIYASLTSGNLSVMFEMTFAIVSILLLVVFYKQIDFPYWLLGMYTIIIPMFSGATLVFCMSRYILTVFPLFIIFAKLSKNKYVDQGLVIVCVLLQAFLMVFWTNQYTILV